MKPKIDQLGILLFSIVIGCDLVFADESNNDQRYEVELIAFSYRTVVDNNEQWPPYLAGEPPVSGRQLLPASAPVTPPQNEHPVAVNSPTVELNAGPTSAITTAPPWQEFRRLRSAQHQLDPLASTLIRRGLADRILLHTGWQQTMRPANNSEPVLIIGGESLATPFLAGGTAANIAPWINPNSQLQTPDYWESPMQYHRGRFELEGTASFYQTRYPRLELDICLIIAAPAGQKPQPISNPRTSRSANARVCSREIRGVRYGELNYFDTPYFGVLAQVRRLDKDQAQEGY